MTQDIVQQWQAVAQIAAEAARAIRAVALAGFAVTQKADASPVTQADMQAHAIIDAGLCALAPEIPIISEENDTQPSLAPHWWCVDPLDGTRSFVRGCGEYTVNIALMCGDVPIMGVIACPLDGAVYAGVVGQGAWQAQMDAGMVWQALQCARNVQDAPRAIVSSAHISERMRELLATLQVGEVRHMASARKFCVIAEGGAEIYPRFGTTMEWDTAAGQALVEATGGRMTTLEGAPFRYTKPAFRNGGFVVYAASAASQTVTDKSTP